MKKAILTSLVVVISTVGLLAQDKASVEKPKQKEQFQWRRTSQDSIPTEDIFIYDPVDEQFPGSDNSFLLGQPRYYIINSNTTVNHKKAIPDSDSNIDNIFPFSRYKKVKPFTDLIDVEHQIK